MMLYFAVAVACSFVPYPICLAWLTYQQQDNARHAGCGPLQRLCHATSPALIGIIGWDTMLIGMLALTGWLLPNAPELTRWYLAHAVALGPGLLVQHLASRLLLALRHRTDIPVVTAPAIQPPADDRSAAFGKRHSRSRH